jgi:uncharacterized linocin/CFP29 family protein
MDISHESLKTFSAMQEGNPVATYKKTILGKVFVNVLDPFSDKPAGIILTGDSGSENARVDVWTLKEDLFLQRMNRSLFERGVLKKVSENKIKKVETFEDSDLTNILGLSYISLQKKLAEIDDSVILMRLVDLAKEAGKSEKIIETLEKKLHSSLTVED